jgi:hypothetical protein
MRLFRPAWDSKNAKRAIKAVVKIKDEAKLVRIAKEARRYDARQAAVERLTNQSVLADIARSDEDHRVRQTAVKRVTDPSVLEDVARNDGARDVRKAAVERVTDPSVLADVARNDGVSDVRKAAVERLVNYDLEDDLLMYIIQMSGDVLKNSKYENERRSAAETLLAYYRRYGTDKQGKAIRMYEGEYKGGYSDHSDYPSPDEIFCCGPHTDTHKDDTYTINFNPENT